MFGKNLLETSVSKTQRANVVAYIVALIIGIVLSVGVALPITISTVTAANVTGTTKTILDIVPVFIALLPVVMVAGYYKFMGA